MGFVDKMKEIVLEDTDDDEREEKVLKPDFKMMIFYPRTGDEADLIADEIKKRNAVVLSVINLSNEDARRTVDFLSGVVYALNGNARKIGKEIVLFTASNIVLDGAFTDDAFIDEQ